MKAPKPTQRFSNTVEHYIRFRPDYPADLLDFLQSELALSKQHIIADIGSGTGKWTKPLLENGNMVYGVEPNQFMREAAEQLFAQYPRFQSIDGTSESTNLPDQSLDFISCAQAFHWFEPKATRQEFQRILRPDGQVLLIWNKRVDSHSPFMEAYHQFLIDYGTDYQETCLRRIDHSILRSFFNFHTKHFFHHQEFDFVGLKGRYLSCSYAYSAEHPQHSLAIDVLKEVFDRYAIEGKVQMWYRTELYYGSLE